MKQAVGAKKEKNNFKAGFTIIELVLVLAIVGLVVLMAFIGFPALQRAQHDTQRRRDVGLVGSQVLQWRTNNPRSKFSHLVQGSQDLSVAVDGNHPLASYFKYDASHPEAPFQALSYNVGKIEVADLTSENTAGRAYVLQFDMANPERFRNIYIINGYGCKDRISSTDSIVLGTDAEDRDVILKRQEIRFPEINERKFLVAIMLESGQLYCRDFSW